jgi:hypothetical protein
MDQLESIGVAFKIKNNCKDDQPTHAQELKFGIV